MLSTFYKSKISLSYLIPIKPIFNCKTKRDLLYAGWVKSPHKILNLIKKGTKRGTDIYSARLTAKKVVLQKVTDKGCYQYCIFQKYASVDSYKRTKYFADPLLD